MSYLDRLKKVAGTDRVITKAVEIKGQDFSFQMKPLTIAESQAAQKLAKSDDANDFALQLLVRKALDENGQKLFQPTDVIELRNMVEKPELDKLLLALISSDEEEEVEEDYKSRKGKV
jgi:hypothetical protein